MGIRGVLWIMMTVAVAGAALGLFAAVKAGGFGRREVVIRVNGLSTPWGADDLAAAHLSIQAAVAQDYVMLRITDQQRDLYATTTEAYARALKLTRAQNAAGVALLSDVALAESQLTTAQAQAVDLDAQRTQLEAEDAQAQAQTQVNVDVIAVYKAMGGVGQPESETLRTASN